jgi:hypothetical protein
LVKGIRINVETGEFKKRKALPDSIYQLDLFCKGCEGKMGAYETVLIENLYGNKECSSISQSNYRIVKSEFDYKLVKLGLLSNLYRISISTHTEMQGVVLEDECEEELRKMIYFGEAKNWFDFPTLLFLNPTGYNFFLPPTYQDKIVQLVVGPAMFFFIIKLPYTFQIKLGKEIMLGDKLTLFTNISSQEVFRALGFVDYEPIL